MGGDFPSAKALSWGLTQRQKLRQSHTPYVVELRPLTRLFCPQLCGPTLPRPVAGEIGQPPPLLPPFFLFLSTELKKNGHKRDRFAN